MKQTRRDFIKSQAVAAAAVSAGITLPTVAFASKEAKKDDGIR